ncbi:MAG: hypothetical protein AAGI23_00455 [Bacteroidota bacterium]
MDYTTEKKAREITSRPTDQYYKDRVPYGRATVVGAVTGIIVALYLLLVEFLTPEGAGSFIKMAKYLIIAPIFYTALKSYKAKIPTGKIFKRGIVYGATMSAVTALVTFGLAVVFQLIFPDVEYSQFLRDVDTAGETIVFDWMVLFETFVFSMIVTFIILQGLKDRAKPE